MKFHRKKKKKKKIGQLLDEVSPLTYEVGQLGYGHLAHIYEKKLGKSLGTKL